MSTIKISDLATSSVSLTDFIVKAGATGIATKNTVQGIADVINADNTLFKETIAIADVPSENGWYFASESGTYTNCGGLVIDTADNIAIIVISGAFDVFNKIDIPVNITIDAIPTDGSTNTIQSGGVFDALILKADKTKLDISNSSFALKSNNSNILNPSDRNVKEGLFYNGSGAETSNSDFCLSGYIKVSSGDNVYLSWGVGGEKNVLFDDNLTQVSITQANPIIASSDGYVRLSVPCTNGLSSNWETQQRFVNIGSLDVYIKYTEIQSSKDFTIESIKNNKKFIQYTSDNSINEKIGGLFLENLDPLKSYYVKGIKYRADNFKLITIHEVNTDVKVCQFVAVRSLSEDNYLLLTQQNASGITGYWFPNQNAGFYGLDNIDLTLDFDLISVVSTSISNFFKSDFIARDETLRVNKLNPLDIIKQKQLVVSDGQLEVVSNTSNFFNHSKVIAISNGESITISNTSLFQSKGYVINSQRKILKTISYTNQNLNLSETVLNDTGEDAYFVTELRKPLVFIGEYPQIEYGTTRSYYEGYLDIPLEENKVEIVLPKKLYGVSGNPFNIFRKNILYANPNDYYWLELEGYDTSKLLHYPQLFNFQNLTAGSTELSARVLKNKTCLNRKLFTYEIFNKLTSGTLNVLNVGDSFTDIADWQSAYYEKLDADGVGVNFIGLKNNLANKHSENQTGGTLQSSFLVDRGNAFLLGVTGFTNDGTFDGFNSATYTDGTSSYFFDGRKVDASGNGFIRITPNGHANTPALNGTLTKSSGTSNFSSIPFTTVETINRNPFFNPATNLIDFEYYLQKFSYESDLNLTNPLTKFVLALQFSWNDNAEFYNEGNLDSVIANFKTFINKFHTQYPNAYVVIGVETVASPIGGNVYNRTLGSTWGRLAFAKEVFKNFEDDVAYNDFCFVNPAYAFVDLENGFNTEEVFLQSRFPLISKTKATDSVHLNPAGMQELGDSYYPIMQKVLSL